MTTCDVLVVGGGPAGSTCAWRLVRAGIDALVVDGATFPRAKPCAGWVTPPVFDDLEISPHEYGAYGSLHPITGFRVAFGSGRVVDVHYGRTVSYAIRRPEFDAYLLQRSGARLHLGCRVRHLRREGDRWIVDDTISANVLVGAGGHFCPVARALNPAPAADAIVGARVVEFDMEQAQEAACPVASGAPELFLDRDLRGYGWIVRKGRTLNVGFGRTGTGDLAAHVAAFVRRAQRLGRLPPGMPAAWPGHAYLLRETSGRSLVGDRVLLVGDAAGLARGGSGEGIRPAIASGIAAAETLIAARGRYGDDALGSYPSRLEARLGPAPARLVPARRRWPRIRSWMAGALLSTRWGTRRFLLDPWLRP